MASNWLNCHLLNMFYTFGPLHSAHFIILMLCKHYQRLTWKHSSAFSFRNHNINCVDYFKMASSLLQLFVSYFVFTNNEHKAKRQVRESLKVEWVRMWRKREQFKWKKWKKQKQFYACFAYKFLAQWKCLNLKLCTQIIELVYKLLLPPMPPSCLPRPHLKV